MNDEILVAMRDYEREVAPAREVIRRARAHLLRTLLEAPADAYAEALFATNADPTEPNGAEFAIDPPSGGGGQEEPVAAQAVVPPAPVSQAEEVGAGTPQGMPPPPAPDDLLYPCPHCERRFAQRQGLAVHLGRQHNEGLPPVEPKRRSQSPWRGGMPGIGKRFDTPAPPRTGGPAESWGCPRCELTFLSREGQQTHFELSGHGSPAPMPGRPVGHRLVSRGGA